jgi:hypothetical protein
VRERRSKAQVSIWENEIILFVKTLSSVILGLLGLLGMNRYLYLSCFHSKDLDLSSPVDAGQLGSELLKSLCLFW